MSFLLPILEMDKRTGMEPLNRFSVNDAHLIHSFNEVRSDLLWQKRSLKTFRWGIPGPAI